jgi:HEAT repeat protein
VVDQSAIEGLIDGLKDTDAYVRQYVARALGWSQDNRAIRPLVELLMIEQSEDVREYAFAALADLGERNVRVARPMALES